MMKTRPAKTKYKVVDTAKFHRATRLQEYRIEKGLTQMQIALALGVTLGAISQAERRVGAISQRKWYQLSDLLQVDVRLLQGYDKESLKISENSLPIG